MMTRRTLLGASLGVAGVPLLAGCRAGPGWEPEHPRPALPRVGYIGQRGGSGPEEFRQGLRDLGYVEGQTIILDVRRPSGSAVPPLTQYGGIAAAFVELPVTVIVTVGPLATTAATQATRMIPIIMSEAVFDPVADGFVQSFARPGGNSPACPWCRISRSCRNCSRPSCPRHRAAIVWLGRFPDPPYTDVWQEGARAVRLELEPMNLLGVSIDAAIAALPAGLDGVLMPALPLPPVTFRPLVEAAARRGLPVVAWQSGWAAAGALLTYGPNPAAMARRVAVYVDKILRGASPAELSVEQPSVLELIINLQTARALNLAIPPAVLAQATEVIQ